MSKIAITVGILLIVVALIFAFGLGEFHATALIPIAFGLPILISGLLAQKEHLRKHAMHVAAVFGLLGVLGSASRAFQLPAALDGTAQRPLAIYESALLFIICLVFVILCVNSFIAARQKA